MESVCWPCKRQSPERLTGGGVSRSAGKRPAAAGAEVVGHAKLPTAAESRQKWSVMRTVTAN